MSSKYTIEVLSRRTFLQWTASALGVPAVSAIAADDALPGYAAHLARALEMKRRAIAAGDQPYGAVVVKDDRLVAEAPSRVITKGDWSAHAEREAMRDAQRRLGTKDLGGCVLVSTSRPCAACERAAFEARIARMIHGEALIDAGAPRG